MEKAHGWLVSSDWGMKKKEKIERRVVKTKKYPGLGWGWEIERDGRGIRAGFYLRFLWEMLCESMCEGSGSFE